MLNIARYFKAMALMALFMANTSLANDTIYWNFKDLDLEKSKELLENALNDAASSGTKTVLTLDILEKKYPNDFVFLGGKLLIKKINNLQQVGSIKFRLIKLVQLPSEEKLSPDILEGIKEAFRSKRTLNKAYLENISIFPQNQGGGYSSDAMKIFHNFVSKVGADFVSLWLGSNTPYAGQTYKKLGYLFTKESLICIKENFPKHSEEEAEAEYLKDTSIDLKDQQGQNCRIDMVRYAK